MAEDYGSSDFKTIQASTIACRETSKTSLRKGTAGKLLLKRSFIVSRPNSGNFKRKRVIAESKMELAESDDEDEVSSNSSNDDGKEKSEILEEENSFRQVNQGEEDTSSAQEFKSESQQQRKENPRSKNESRKRKLEKTDMQLNRALASLNSTLSKPQSEKKQRCTSTRRR
eukprot:gene13339-14718_t